MVQKPNRTTEGAALKRSGLPSIAWVLVGLLGVAALLLTLGQQDTETNPEVSSFSPSGISAFSELLKQNGVSVVVDQQPKPRLMPNDILVAFARKSPDEISLAANQNPEAEFRNYFWKQIQDGHSGILLNVDKDFSGGSKKVVEREPLLVNDSATGESFKVSTSLADQAEIDDPDELESMVDVTLWTNSNLAFLKAYRFKQGTALVVKDGIGITNRFIDKNDNARAFTSLISILHKPGSRVVFAEASFGNVHERGLLETIGPWANAAWQQLLFLGVVVVFTLGRRFGLPEETRTVQRGSRELLDAVGDTFHRAKSTQIALETAWLRADIELRLVLKLPKDASRDERDRLLPDTLQNALRRLEAAKQMDRVASDQALILIQKAQLEMDAFLGTRRSNSRRLAKLKK